MYICYPVLPSCKTVTEYPNKNTDIDTGKTWGISITTQFCNIAIL